MPPTAAVGAPARVLLVNLNRYDQPYPVYPVGLAYLDAALRGAGYATRLWDARAAAEPLWLWHAAPARPPLFLLPGCAVACSRDRHTC